MIGSWWNRRCYAREVHQNSTTGSSWRSVQEHQDSRLHSLFIRFSSFLLSENSNRSPPTLSSKCARRWIPTSTKNSASTFIPTTRIKEHCFRFAKLSSKYFHLISLSLRTISSTLPPFWRRNCCRIRCNCVKFFGSRAPSSSTLCTSRWCLTRCVTKCHLFVGLIRMFRLWSILRTAICLCWRIWNRNS